MSPKFTSIIYLTLWLPNTALCGVMDGWDDPFLVAINSLKSEQWHPNHLTEKDFQKSTREIWHLLKTNRKDWKALLQPNLLQEQAVTLRHEFANKQYVERVFSTKSGTLVFQLTKYSHIILKIDNRLDTAFNVLDRSYLAAFEKTNEIQKLALKNEFSHLYLPRETGKISKAANTKVVFSETIPVFSYADIDNLVLLHMLLTSAENDEKLRNSLKETFSQVITYICRVDFDDIKYRNVPFTKDGRLAPFDTDTALARTGVETFLEAFFVFKILSKNDILEIVSKNCSKPYANAPKNIHAFYNDLSVLNSIFYENDKTLRKIIDFLSTRTSETDRLFSLSENMNGEDKKYASIIESIFTRKITDKANNLQVFGRRCEHVQHLITEAGTEIHNASNGKIQPNDCDEKAVRVLQMGQDNGYIYGTASISQLRGFAENDLRSFVCF